MSTTTDLRECSGEQVREFLDSFDVVLSDCDGVLWQLDSPIEGAIEALERLQRLGKRVYLVTNNSTRSADDFCAQLRAGGFDAKPEQIINPATTISWYLRKINFQGEAFTLAAKEFDDVLRDAGFEVAPHPKIIEGDVKGTLQTMQVRPTIKAVISDFDINCNWVKLAFAISCLSKDDMLYLVGAPDEWIPYGINRKLLGPGPLTNVISEQSGKKPINCAKPSEVLKDYIYEKCGLTDPRRCLFIGDTVNNDMKFGDMCGFLKFFVSTGCYTLEDAQEKEDTTPDYYLRCFGELLPILDNLEDAKLSNHNDA